MDQNDRKEYAAPELRTYGAVTKIVQGASAMGMPDTVGTMMR